MTRGGGLHAAIVERARVAAWDDMVAEVEPVRESVAAVADRTADLSQAAFDQTIITEEQARQLALLARVVPVLISAAGLLEQMAAALVTAGSPAAPLAEQLSEALAELAQPLVSDEEASQEPSDDEQPPSTT